MSSHADTSAPQPAPHSNNNFSFILLLCFKVTLDGTNYNDWMRNIKMALRFEDREYILEKELIEVDRDTATPEEYASYKKHYDDATKVACIMVATMVPELQRIQRYVERLQKLNMQIDEELAIDMVLNSLASCYDQFILAYHLNNTQTTLDELHNMLQTAEDALKGKGVPSANSPVMAIGRGKKRKAPPKQNWKGKA
ncbi:hypothetical protein L2E82_45635 [Cichorium intybus]|uniref:Uncharacterized protein n=1 Tax=Cichorium intybus TaxID=13427 RepID=A0ACB8ZSM0_CICIN|nr:hypothetical protein L2E82_45635 [Cichorium intybus]